MYDAIIILGSTATGKTNVSIKLAKALKTEIINADSMYIYKDLSIGTAKPTIEEMDGITHHLIDVANPEDSFNVVDYRNLAINVINEFKEKNLIPIIVGGTGFYIDSYTNNYTYGEASYSYEIRQQLKSELSQFGKEYIFEKLKKLSPDTAQRLHVNDTVRVIRALEICLQTGNELKNSNTSEAIIKNPLYIGLTMDREVLYDRINRRVDIMVNNGLIEEVISLYNKGYTTETHQSMKGIGYKEIVEYLKGECELTDAIDKIKQHTRNYAKRQITWFKRNKEIHWFNPLEDKNIINKIIELYNKQKNY